MRDNFGIFYFGLILGAIFMGAMLELLSNDEPITSSRAITPELEIKVKDGIVDTVWVYRKPVEK